MDKLYRFHFTWWMNVLVGILLVPVVVSYWRYRYRMFMDYLDSREQY